LDLGLTQLSHPVDFLASLLERETNRGQKY
jgi:hypothetical protein